MDGLTVIPGSCWGCPEVIRLVADKDLYCDYQPKVFGFGSYRHVGRPELKEPPPDWCPRRAVRELDKQLRGGKITMPKKKEKKIKLRPCVQWFAEQMEMALRSHDDDRGEAGWRDDHPASLLERLQGEAEELEAALDEFDVFDDMVKTIGRFNLEVVGGKTSVEANRFDMAEKAIKEAADTANFAMMIADVLYQRHTGGGE